MKKLICLLWIVFVVITLCNGNINNCVKRKDGHMQCEDMATQDKKHLKRDNDCTKEGEISNENGDCICNKTYYRDSEDGSCKPCKIECGSCSHYALCTTCKDENAFISDGVCICPHSYLTETGLCYVCEDDCEYCDKNGCLKYKSS